MVFLSSSNPASGAVDLGDASWRVITTRSGYIAAAEVLVAANSVLVTDSTVAADAELIAIAVQHCSAVIQAKNLQCAVKAAKAAIADGSTEVKPAGSPYKKPAITSYIQDTKNRSHKAASLTAAGEDRSEADTEDGSSFQPQPANAAAASQPAASETPAHPATPTAPARPAPQRNRSEGMFSDAPDPGELLSIEEIKALLGDSDLPEPTDSNDR